MTMSIWNPDIGISILAAGDNSVRLRSPVYTSDSQIMLRQDTCLVPVLLSSGVQLDILVTM